MKNCFEVAMMLNESILDAIKNRKYSLRPVNVEVAAPMKQLIVPIKNGVIQYK